MKEKAERAGQLTGPALEALKRHTFYGREKDDTIYPIALANLILHGVDEPHLWHGNTLSGVPTYAELFHGAPQFFDYVLMNPPFGGKEGKEARKAQKTSPAKLDVMEEQWKAAERAVREALAKAESIEQAVYDLKAVNPNRTSDEDTRTPAQLLDFINNKGREADAALARLRGLIAKDR